MAFLNNKPKKRKKSVKNTEEKVVVVRPFNFGGSSKSASRSKQVGIGGAVFP